VDCRSSPSSSATARHRPMVSAPLARADEAVDVFIHVSKVERCGALDGASRI
jgi:hypothetical protein